MTLPDWVAFHDELATKLLDFEDRQDELIDFLAGLLEEGHKVVSVNDNTDSGRLEEIDPFTFMASWNRMLKVQDRLAIARRVGDWLGVSALSPTSFRGIPRVQNLGSWFIDYADKRGPTDVATLWALFREAVEGEVRGETFDRCLQVRKVAIAKLTSGLFWIAPTRFLAADQHSAGCGLARIEGEEVEVTSSRLYGANGRIRDWAHYSRWLDELRTAGVDDFVDFSIRAFGRAWLIAPGRGAELFDDFFREGIIGIGWDYLGDLRKYRELEPLRQAISDHDKTDKSPVHRGLTCYEFAHVMFPGDKVFAKRGTTEIVGYGEITSAYRFEPERQRYKHVRSVEWTKRGRWHIDDARLARKTLLDLDGRGALQETLEAAVAQPPYPVAAMRWLADLIAAAAETNSAGWRIAVPDATGRIWLVVGHDAVAGFGPDGRFFVTTHLDDHVEQTLVDSGLEVSASGRYPKMFRTVEVPRGDEATAYELLASSSEKALREWASRWDAVTNREHHRGDILELLERELGMTLPRPDGGTNVMWSKILESVLASGLRLSDRTIRRYHVALSARGFVILSGISGSGKTSLTRAYADATGGEYQLVPVAPNWTTNEDLLGYFNPLDNVYHDTEASRFVRRAAEAWEGGGDRARKFHLVLDEMNLARVEHYFSKFLSLMEVRQAGGDAVLELGTDKVVLPPNLYVIGTVNIDETTHGFADKVYDRAQLIELEAPRELLAAHCGDAPWKGDVMAMWDCVKDVAPFGFRVIDEVRVYAEACKELEVGWEEAVDEQLLQKVLPKIKGMDPQLGAVLQSVADLCGERFPLTRAKAEVMLTRFKNDGFASFF